VRLILLGPQRRPTLDAVLRSLPPDGTIATVTAGWQEREPDDRELSERLGSRDLNLGLHGRWLDLLDRDHAFASAERKVRAAREEMQEIYLLRLNHALQAVQEIQRRGGNGGLRADALTDAMASVRELDASHLRWVAELRAEFYQVIEPHNRPQIAEHRAAITAVLGRATALVIAGGHVGVLTDVLHLFNVAPSLRAPVIAWSAGAMALTERIVLFDDRAPQGPGCPELYGSGLGLLRNFVPLPHARARLRLDDAPRMAMFASRFAPARCVLLETGTRIDTDPSGSCPPGTRMLAADGRVTVVEPS
jgi:hypothetical protein